MLSRQFISWAARAAAGERAEAAGNLARAFLYAELDPIERGEMERTMTLLLDDASPLVRRALAEALSRSAEAPHHLVVALANDQPDIGAVVLARSPRLTDADLIDAAALGETPAQCAIAARPGLSAAVAGALAEVGSAEAVLTLGRNHAATLADVSIRRILERFGHDGETREALSARPDLTDALRHEIVVATAHALRDFVIARGWMSPERAGRASADAADRATLHLAARHADGEPGQIRFVGHLRRTGRLTPALVIRALLSGQVGLFEAALAELTGQRLGRVSGLVRRPHGLGFAALVRSSGLPDSLLPMLCAALDARRPATPPAMLSREVVSRVLARCGLEQDMSVAGLTALLGRFEAEAARDESRVASAPQASPERVAASRTEPRFAPDAAALAEAA